MSHIRYTNAQRLTLAIERDAALVAERATYSDADIAELTGATAGEDVQTSLRLYTWDDFAAAYRAGDILNAHRGIIERDGALR